MLIGNNPLLWLICYYAIVGYIGVAVPVDTELTPAKTQNTANEIYCELIIYSEGFEKNHKMINCDKISIRDDDWAGRRYSVYLVVHI